jgi:hypothetical protein
MDASHCGQSSTAVAANVTAKAEKYKTNPTITQKILNFNFFIKFSLSIVYPTANYSANSHTKNFIQPVSDRELISLYFCWRFTGLEFQFNDESLVCRRKFGILKASAIVRTDHDFRTNRTAVQNASFPVMRDRSVAIRAIVYDS